MNNYIRKNPQKPQKKKKIFFVQKIGPRKLAIKNGGGGGVKRLKNKKKYHQMSHVAALKTKWIFKLKKKIFF